MNFQILKPSAFIFMLALILSSCKSEAPKTTEPEVQEEVTTEEEPQEPIFIDGHPTVVIDQMVFTPETLTISKGDTVVFINKDIFMHNAVETDSTWYSPILSTGDIWRFAPESTTDYYCSLHLVMKGKIVVE